MSARVKGMGGHQSGGRGERVWLTPPNLIQALGEFDLDPCFGSPRPWDTAARHFGPDSGGGFGGLHEEWFGRVWCNPPYDRHAFKWLEKCAEHGNAIALVFARTEVEQFHRQVWEKADALIFLEGRLYFHHPDGARAAANGGAPSVLIAYGDHNAECLKQKPISGAFVDLRNSEN